MTTVKTILCGMTAITMAVTLSMGTGCEKTSDSNNTLTVTPGASTIQGNQAVTLVAANTNGVAMLLPLEWKVSNPDLGIVTGSAGDTAVYESNGRIGVNTITVKDSSFSEGVASVTQQ